MPPLDRFRSGFAAYRNGKADEEGHQSAILAFGVVSLSGAGAGPKEDKPFFFEKKNQKTFVPVLSAAG
jgi:hypothetical protein